MKHLNEYNNAESESYEEKGLEGVTAKEVLMNLYPSTIIQMILDFDKQCDGSVEFKNKNLNMLRSLITFFMKRHGTTEKAITALIKKHNIK